MGAQSRVVTDNASNSAANFRREILKPSPIENVGNKLPGYSFGRLCRHLWPHKTPASIEFYTGIAERTARHLAADKSDPASATLVRILDSDQGWRALEWILRESKQSWWTEAKRAKRCAAAFEAEQKQMEML